jgi:hypothetical protein
LAAVTEIRDREASCLVGAAKRRAHGLRVDRALPSATPAKVSVEECKHQSNRDHENNDGADSMPTLAAGRLQSWNQHAHAVYWHVQEAFHGLAEPDLDRR